MADERQATIDRIVGECVEAGMPTGFEGTLRGSLADAWRAALAAREEPPRLTMKEIEASEEEIKVSEIRFGDDVVLGGKCVESIRRATYGRIFLKDGNGRWHELTQNATVLCAREDTERPDANHAALGLLQKIAGGLPYTASSADLISEAERALAQLGLECPNCDHGRILGVKWEQKSDSGEPVPIESEEPCETCGGSGFVVRGTERLDQMPQTAREMMNRIQPGGKS